MTTDQEFKEHGDVYLEADDREKVLRSRRYDWVRCGFAHYGPTVQVQIGFKLSVSAQSVSPDLDVLLWYGDEAPLECHLTISTLFVADPLTSLGDGDFGMK